MGGGRGRENGGGYAGNAGHGDFAGEGTVAEDLGRGVEVAEGVGGDYHDCFLGVALRTTAGGGGAA